MNSNIFRKTAMDSIATPEQLDQQVKIMKPVTWLILVTLIVGLITLVLWSVTGNITNGTSFAGVVFPNSDVKNMTVNYSGIVKDVLVAEGDYIEVGDIIGVVYNQNALDYLEEIKYNMSAGDEGSKEYEAFEEMLAAAKQSYISNSMITSSYSGYVQSVKRCNAVVAEGDTIAVIMINDEASTYNEVVVYVPIQTAITLSLGMEAQISPAFAPREEYGYMEGVITSISSIPITEESILKHMGTLSYVQDILPEKTCVEVRIKLSLYEASVNSYKWSNPNGENLPVEIGTMCDVFVVTKEQKPINLLLE